MMGFEKALIIVSVWAFPWLASRFPLFYERFLKGFFQVDVVYCELWKEVRLDG